jgi:hypothetical protein
VMMWTSETADETLPGDSSAPDDDDTRTMIPDRAGGRARRPAGADLGLKRAQ